MWQKPKTPPNQPPPGEDVVLKQRQIKEVYTISPDKYSLLKRTKCNKANGLKRNPKCYKIYESAPNGPGGSDVPVYGRAEQTSLKENKRIRLLRKCSRTSLWLIENVEPFGFSLGYLFVCTNYLRHGFIIFKKVQIWPFPFNVARPVKMFPTRSFLLCCWFGNHIFSFGTLHIKKD